MVPLLPLVLAILLSDSMSVFASHLRSRTTHKGLGKRIAGELNILNDLNVFPGSRWTFYNVGLGACGGTNDDREFVVALNAIQFGVGYPGPQCFKKITMEYNGKKATAAIVDMCPECPYGALDLSRSLFNFFAPEDEGVIYGQWHFGEDSRRGGDEGKRPPSPPPTKPKPKTTKPKPTHAKVHIPPPFDPVRIPPGVAHPTHASRPFLNHPGKQRPASEKKKLPSPARIPPGSESNTGFVARPNGKFIMGPGSELLSSNPAIFKPSTSNAASILKNTPHKSEYISDEESETSENLVKLNRIFGRLGSIAVVGSAANRDE